MSPMFKQKVGMTKIYAKGIAELFLICLLYTSPSPRD